jgi:hypothetical protein
MLFTPVPFWKPFSTYPREIHYAALRKFGVLWLISVAPLILAALLSPIGTNAGALGYIAGFLKELVTEFNGTHQFIYAVSFITPILYLVIERYSSFVEFFKSNRRKAQGVVKIPPEGFGWTLFWSFAVFLFTIAGYVAATTVALRNEKTFLDSLSQSTVFDPPITNFRSAKKKGEEDLSAALDKKISEGDE